MTVTARQPQFADASPARLPYRAPEHARRRVLRVVQERVWLSDLQQGNIDWVEEVRRIARAQDAEAFARLFAHFAPRLKAFLMKSGADEASAEECVQDVMVTVWRKAPQFDPTRASAATWIYTIARNRRIDLLRRQRRPEPEELAWGPEEEPDQFDVLSFQQDSERLAEALAQLPEKQRVLIERAYFGDLSQSEIAELTGLPLGTIKSRIRMALEKLRHALSHEGTRQ